MKYSVSGEGYQHKRAAFCSMCRNSLSCLQWALIFLYSVRVQSMSPALLGAWSPELRCSAGWGQGQLCERCCGESWRRGGLPLLSLGLAVWSLWTDHCDHCVWTQFWSGLAITLGTHLTFPGQGASQKVTGGRWGPHFHVLNFLRP